MAFSHQYFNDQLPAGRVYRQWFNAVDEMLEIGSALNALIPTMIDGDGSNISMFNEVTARFGFPDNTTAKASWEEFQSAYSKVSGDGSVSSVNTALKQFLAKTR